MNNICEVCSTAMKPLFTSSYCPICDSEDLEDLSDDGTVLELPSNSWPELNKKYVLATELTMESYLNQIKDYLIKTGYKVVDSSDANNIDYSVELSGSNSTYFKYRKLSK